MNNRHRVLRPAFTAATALVLLVFASQVRADVSISENAAELFAQAVEHLRSKKPGSADKALATFQAAYADSPSWKILGNLGLSAYQLERYQEADDYLRRYLREGSEMLKDDEKASIRRKLNIVGLRKVPLRLEVAGKGAFSVIDERFEQLGAMPMVNEYGPFEPLDNIARLVVRAGNHRVRIVRDGFEEAVRIVVVAPGEARTEQFTLTPTAPKTPEEPLGPELQRGQQPTASSGWWSVPVWTTGIGVVAIAAGSGFLLKSRSVQGAEQQRFTQQCGGSVSTVDEACGAVTAGSRNAATWRTAGVAALGVAAASLSTAAAFYWFSSGPATDQRDSAAESWLVQGAISPWSVSLSGRF